MAPVEIPSDIRAIADARWEAKRMKDRGSADALRDDLMRIGWSMIDGKDEYELVKI
jgi:cysteinyl-tRNA synthetase